MIASNVTPQPVHLASEEVGGAPSEATALGVWPGSDVRLPGSGSGSFPFPVAGNW